MIKTANQEKLHSKRCAGSPFDGKVGVCTKESPLKPQGTGMALRSVQRSSSACTSQLKLPPESAALTSFSSSSSCTMSTKEAAVPCAFHQARELVCWAAEGAEGAGDRLQYYKQSCRAAQPPHCLDTWQLVVVGLAIAPASSPSQAAPPPNPTQPHPPTFCMSLLISIRTSMRAARASSFEVG